MARLIDADALLNECAECQKTDPHFEGRGWASHFINDAGEPSTEWYCVEEMIENATTVDAIPLDWLRDKMMERQMLMTKNPFGYVLAEWLEQEANNG